MPTPTAVVIELTDEERGRLEAWARRGKTAQALADYFGLKTTKPATSAKKPAKSKR